MLEVEGNVHWLGAKILTGGVDSEVLCAMDDVEMRALEDREERARPSTSSRCPESMNMRQELMRAETHGPKFRVRPDPGNPSEAERDEHNATQFPLRSWCGRSCQIVTCPRRRLTTSS